MDKETPQKFSCSKGAGEASNPHPPQHRLNLPHPPPPVCSPSSSHSQTSSHDQAPTTPDQTTLNYTPATSDSRTGNTQAAPSTALSFLPDMFSSWLQPTPPNNSTPTMSRRPNNPRYSSFILPTPAGENIATREYYHPLSTDEYDYDMDFPSAPQSPKRAAVQPAERVERSPSPTPSEILLQSELQDLPVLSAVNEKMRREGRTEAERKVRLVRLREKLEERRLREKLEERREREREEAHKRSR